MSSPLLLMLALIGMGCLYLSVVAWSFRASARRDFSTPWLLLPPGGAAIIGGTLVFGVPVLQASMLFKLLELAAHLCNILLIWVIAGKLMPSNRLPATLLYAWNPLVLIELAVYANTAGVVICLLLLAVAMLLVDTSSSFLIRAIPASSRGGGWVDVGRGRLRCPHPVFAKHPVLAGDASVPSLPDLTPAPTNDERLPGGLPQYLPVKTWLKQAATLLLLALAIRINFIALLLAPLLLWFMTRHTRGVSMALIGFMWRALVVLAIFIVAYLPDWQGSATFLVITNALHLFGFANSPLSLIVMPARSFFSFVAQRAHFPPLMQPAQAADMTVLATSFFLFALVYAREMGGVRAHSRLHSPRPVDALFTGWTIVLLGYIVLAATVFSPGYIVWEVWVVALRRFDTLSVCVLLLSCCALLYYPLQQLASASTGFLVPLCVFGIPLVYLVAQRCIPAGRIERKNVLT